MAQHVCSSPFEAIGKGRLEPHRMRAFLVVEKPFHFLSFMTENQSLMTAILTGNLSKFV